MSPELITIIIGAAGILFAGFVAFRKAQQAGNKHAMIVAILNSLEQVAETADPVHTQMVKSAINAAAKEFGFEAALEAIKKELA